jgi:hypothetical protein
MLSFLLKVKHWQLFLLTFGLPAVVVVVLMTDIYSGDGGEYPDPFVLMATFSSMPLLMIVLLIAIFGWQWAVVVGLQRRIPPEAKFSLVRFKVLFFVPIVYIMFFATLVGMIMIGIFTEIAGMDLPDAASITGVTGLILVMLFFHFFSIFCIFHSIYFAAKTLKTVELQRSVSFSEFAEEFFLIWFYPVGIWVLQPKINALVR